MFVCYLDAMKPPHTPVNTCSDFKCSESYELKDNYDDLTCDGDCEDRDCCERGGCPLCHVARFKDSYELHDT